MQLTSRIVHCDKHEVMGVFRSVLATLEQTFDQEQHLMEEFQFPILKCHMEQHARVLASLHHLHRDVMAGDIACARRVAGELLPEWFDLHRATQDATLGIWVAYCQHAGQTSILDHRENESSHFDKQLPQHCQQKPSTPNKTNRHIGPLL
jgi:hemerythrin